MSLEQIAVIVVAIALASIVKSALGVGFPIVAMPILAAWFDVPFAIAILIAPIIVTNAMQIWQHRAERGNLPFLWRLVPSAMVGIVIGTLLLANLHGSILSILLACTVVLYLALRLFRPDWRITPSAAMAAAPLAGLVSGFLQGSTGISAPVSVSFLNAMKLSREAFILAASTLFIGFSVTQLPSLVYTGIMTGERALLSIFAVLPTFAAMPVGSWLGKKFGAVIFDRIIMAMLAAIAIKLFYEALFGG